MTNQSRNRSEDRMNDQGNVVPLARPSARQLIAIDAERPSETWLTAQVAGMLSIYPRRDEDADLSKLALGLWVDCLSDLPREAIERAIRRRLQSSSRWSPVPGEIRELAQREMEKPARAHVKPPFASPEPISDSVRHRISAELSRLSRELGSGPSLKKINEGRIERIVNVAADVCGVSPTLVRSPRKSADVVMVRFLACLAARNHTNASFPEIGRAIGDRDHTTILHACEQAEERIASDPKWAEAHAEIERRLGA